MAVLKSVRASTLMETLVATVLIVVIFMISSMLMNNMFSNALNGNSDHMREHLNRLVYEYGNGNLMLPYYEEREDCEFSVLMVNENGTDIIRFEVADQRLKKTMRKSVVHAQ